MSTYHIFPSDSLADDAVIVLLDMLTSNVKYAAIRGQWVNRHGLCYPRLYGVYPSVLKHKTDKDWYYESVEKWVEEYYKKYL